MYYQVRTIPDQQLTMSALIATEINSVMNSKRKLITDVELVALFVAF